MGLGNHQRLDSPTEAPHSICMPVTTHPRGVGAGDAVSSPGPKLTMRRAYLTVHLWVGTVAALFLFALGISGSIIAFENEIDRALNPKLTWIDPGQTRLTLAQTIRSLKTANPGFQVEVIAPSQRDDVAWVAYLANENNDDGVVVALDAEAWEERRQRLEKLGSPLLAPLPR